MIYLSVKTLVEIFSIGHVDPCFTPDVCLVGWVILKSLIKLTLLEFLVETESN